MNRTGTALLCMVFAGLSASPAFPQEGEAQSPEPSAKPPVVSHELENRGACMMCHSGKLEAAPGVPESHAGRPDATCLWCHAPDAAVQTTEPPAIPHDLEGRSSCMMCHTAGKLEAVPDVPEDHAERTDEFCVLCHSPAPAAAEPSEG